MLQKSKFYKGKDKTINNQANTQSSHSYAQMFKINIKDIIKIKYNFPNLSAKKIEEVHKVLNIPKNNKPRLNMIMKGLLRKQVLVLISSANLEKFIVLSSKHVANCQTYYDLKTFGLVNKQNLV